MRGSRPSNIKNTHVAANKGQGRGKKKGKWEGSKYNQKKIPMFINITNKRNR